MSEMWRIRVHFSDHALFYLSALAGALVIGAFVALGHWRHSAEASRAAEVSKWSKLEATVVSSEISEINTSDETSFSTRISVNLVLRYVVAGKPRDTEYYTSWHRKDPKDWGSLLSPGKKIPIRVSPEDANKLSLLDLIGVP